MGFDKKNTGTMNSVNGWYGWDFDIDGVSYEGLFIESDNSNNRSAPMGHMAIHRKGYEGKIGWWAPLWEPKKQSKVWLSGRFSIDGNDIVVMLYMKDGKNGKFVSAQFIEDDGKGYRPSSNPEKAKELSLSDVKSKVVEEWKEAYESVHGHKDDAAAVAILKDTIKELGIDKENIDDLKRLIGSASQHMSSMKDETPF